MRIIRWILLMTFISAGLYAQNAGNGAIKGRVTESGSAKPVEYATVTVIDNTTGKTVTGAYTDNTGKFTVNNVPAGSYKIAVEFMGYQRQELPVINVTKGATADIKTISLTQSTKNLQTVTVTGRTPLIENRIDKMVYNAEKDLTSVGGVATDILKKVPQVDVDVDGNVQLAGNGSIRFLINGKPSTAFGSNMADVLQSIPASQIKSVEVITNPGAKYDAQGLGGIINIILKQDNAEGVNGNLALTGGTRVENGAFNFNARTNNFGFNAFFSGNTRLAVNTPYNSSRLSLDTASRTSSALTQAGSSSMKRYGIESGLGFDWTYKKYNSFLASVNYNVFERNDHGYNDQQLAVKDDAGQVLSNTLSRNNNSGTNRQYNVDAAFTYKRTFKREDQELEFAANSSFGNSTGIAANEQLLMPAKSLYYGIQSRNPGKENESQFSLDYTHPLAKNVLLGTGLKTTLLDISSNSSVYSFDVPAKPYIYDPSLSNSLQYHQQVYAAYAEISFPVKNIVDVKAGGRYERTETNSYYSNAQDKKQAPGYNTFVPSVYLSRKLGETQLVKLSYSKRIERPDYGDLNPFINTSDPQNITAGNPYLSPELGQRAELAYSKDFGNTGSLMLTAFFRHNADDIQPYVQYYNTLQVGDSVYHNVSVSTRENIGVENNTGLNIFSDLHLTSKLGLRTNLSFFQRHIINTIDAGPDRTSFNYKLNLNASYQFTNLLSGEFFGNFNSARNEVQGRYPSFTTYSFAVRQQLWHKKASLALTTTNPFNEYVTQRLELFGTNFTTTSVRKIPFRSVGVSFTWRFGLLEFKKDDKEPADPNMSL